MRARGAFGGTARAFDLTRAARLLLTAGGGLVDRPTNVDHVVVMVIWTVPG